MDTTAEATRTKCPKEQAKSQNKACAPPASTLDAQNNVTRLTDTSHTISNNQMGFDELKTMCTLDDAQSPNKEPMAGMTQVRHVSLITHHEDSIWITTITLPTRLPEMKMQLQKLIRQFNHTGWQNSEAILRQAKKELLYCMVVSFPI